MPKAAINRSTPNSCVCSAPLFGHFARFKTTRRPPCCACGGVLKSATISFGQSLRTTDLERAAAAAVQADLVLALGSTLSVYPAASFPLLAAERGTPYVIVNRGASEHDDHPSVTLRLEGDVTDIVPPAVEAALGRHQPSRDLEGRSGLVQSGRDET